MRTRRSMRGCSQVERVQHAPADHDIHESAHVQQADNASRGPSAQDVATIDVKRLANDVLGVIRGQEHSGSGDLLGSG